MTRPVLVLIENLPDGSVRYRVQTKVENPIPAGLIAYFRNALAEELARSIEEELERRWR